MNTNPLIILAIESAIGGGSISLLSGGVEIANRIGASSVSRAEDLLANIDEMLRENNISKNEIGLLAVSAGPGSFTGIRIGLATALGLKAGLSIEMASESALKAMAYGHDATEKLTAALPVGRNAICVQSFQVSGDREVAELDEPHAVTEAKLAQHIAGQTETTFLVHSALFETLAPIRNVIDFGDNIALAIANICSRQAPAVVEPLFISKNF